MRINKYLALCGVASRRKVEDFVINGLVKVNNKVVTNLATDIDIKNDVVTVSGERVKLTEEYVYYMLNKPKGYVCSAEDNRGRKTVLDIVKDPNHRIFPVGRLDYDSEGMLILTNDGDLTQRLTHPSNEVEKKYIVKIEGSMVESELAVLRAGVVIDGERFGKCDVVLTNTDGKISRLEVTLKEGKNREIRRMFEAIGKNVIFLKRVSIGMLKLGGLTRGEFRTLKPFEIDMLLAKRDK